MSTFKVTAEKLVIHPHSNADALELAQVGEYRAVVPKGEYKTGDWALYIPEAGVLPDELIEELGLVGKLAGKEKNRVKAVRLRGELSQGIVCRPRVVVTDWNGDTEFWQAVHDTEQDFAPMLGIEKYVPEIPAHMSGEVEAAPDLVRWIEVENLQRYPDVFSRGEPVIATEKIHGTCCIFSMDADDRLVQIASKGFGEKFLALKYAPENLYWRVTDAYPMLELAELVLDTYRGAGRVGVFGEVYGAGVQDLHYGANAGRNETLGYRVFDIAIVEQGGGDKVWLPQSEMHYLCAQAEVPSVPQLYSGPFDFDLLATFATGTSTLADHVREGLVIRADPERRSDVLGGRAIGKLINPDYLTRKGGTEYE